LIAGNKIERNSATLNGGGVALVAPSEAVVSNNLIRNNECTADGGGIWAWILVGGATIVDNSFFENRAGDHGGGLYASNNGRAGFFLIKGNLFVRNEARGIEPDNTGSGGALWTWNLEGRIERNTMVFNRALGESNFNGGGILLDNTDHRLQIVGNIIAFNEGCGLVCRDLKRMSPVLGPNILWANSIQDLAANRGVCPSDWDMNLVFEDPQFCNPATDDYRVSSSSPAFGGEGVMGAFEVPGCGPASYRAVGWGERTGRHP
jgi:parallel beta-helix repeat protein/predicted outer membrane repeat protein